MSADLRDVWKRLAEQWILDYRWEMGMRCYARAGFGSVGMTPPPPKYIREELLNGN